MPNKAKTYTLASKAFLQWWIAVILTVLIIFKHQVVRFYSTDSEVIDLFLTVFPLWCLSVFADLNQGSNAGIIRAIGYQRTAVIIGVIAYWILMDLFSYILGFKYKLGFVGIWIGIPWGAYFISISYVIIIILAPWNKIAEIASKSKKISYEDNINSKLI